MTEKLIIAAVLVVLGFGGGWTANGWRLGEKLATAEGEAKALATANDGLLGANNRCAVNVADVKAGVKEVVDAGVQAAREARDAMDRAAGKAQPHMDRANEVLNRKPVPPAEWCQAVQKEATAYAAVRRGLRMDLNLKGKP